MKKKITFLLLGIFYQFIFAQNNNPYQPDFRNEDFGKVIETAKKQLKINSKDSMANYYMAFSYANLKQHKKAIENFEIAKKSGLKGPYVLLWLAKSYVAENDNEKALRELEALDSLQVGFSRQLDDAIFNSLRDNERFKTISKNMYKRANPCKFDENYRKFDFWFGEWEVYSQGQKIAESSITNTNGDCGILENWRPTNSNGGNSISYYDSTDKKWKQNWVANGSVSHYEEPENYKDGNMQLIAKSDNVWYKMVYTRNEAEDTVRQTLESSTDEGETWTISFNGLYKRKQKD
ncbi:tetratricopeptide repeat protein [Winogradskyella luteola]|uniref:Tetratricopeptide repeat protein n=1 Tax=Winogradskyella luteola TaxID=2828330 RepID=A0A9X1FBL0_9FLAO|nr:hypothetical protein [Winogradskyella luteola]MBV7270003.1 hypothetical protein [Winogradskyella luteola]